MKKAKAALTVEAAWLFPLILMVWMFVLFGLFIAAACSHGENKSKAQNKAQQLFELVHFPFLLYLFFF